MQCKYFNYVQLPHFILNKLAMLVGPEGQGSGMLDIY